MRKRVKRDTITPLIDIQIEVRVFYELKSMKMRIINVICLKSINLILKMNIKPFWHRHCHCYSRIVT